MNLTLDEILAGYDPETHGREQGWTEFSKRLWAEESSYMTHLFYHMRKLRVWFGEPVKVHDGVVQDGHHRLMVWHMMGRWDQEIPVQEVIPSGEEEVVRDGALPQPNSES